MPLLDAAFCAILRNQSRAPICYYRVSAERIGLARESGLADDFLQNPRVNWPRTRGRWTCINQDALSTDRQSFSVEACFWVRGRLPERNFLPWGQKLFGGEKESRRWRKTRVQQSAMPTSTSVRKSRQNRVRLHGRNTLSKKMQPASRPLGCAHNVWPEMPQRRALRCL